MVRIARRVGDRIKRGTSIAVVARTPPAIQAESNPEVINTMKVKEIMTPNPKACGPDDTLGAAAQLMWDADCGILPVEEAGKLVGVVTDRDMYIALATRNRLPSDVRVSEVATKATSTCQPEDDVLAALATMKQKSVRRLPVVGPEGVLVGVLSMNDIVLAAGPKKGNVATEAVVDALQAICAHSRRTPQPVAA